MREKNETGFPIKKDAFPSSPQKQPEKVKTAHRGSGVREGIVNEPQESQSVTDESA